MLKGRKGQTSIMLCIIVMASVALCSVFVDVSRITSGKAQVERAAACAVRSALAAYNAELKDEYGIFALDRNDEDELEGIIGSYLDRNLMAEDEEYRHDGYFDLYGFKLEEISVVPFFNLSDNRVTRQQILEYMKYRAPKQIAEDIWDRLSAVKESGKMSETYKRKMDVDKLLGKLDRHQQLLKKCVDGTDDSSCFVNGFNRNGERGRIIAEYAELYVRFKSLQRNLAEIKSRISALDGRDDDESREELSKLRDRKEDISGEIKQVNEKLKSTWEKIYTQQTIDFIAPNEQAIESIKEIIRLGKNAEDALRGLEDYVGLNFGKPGEISSGFKDIVEDDMDSVRELILESGGAGKILEEITSNVDALENAVAVLDRGHAAIWNKSAGELSRDRIIEILTGGYGEDYSFVEYDYSRPLGTGKGSDPRGGVGERVEEAFSEDEDDKNEDADIGKAGIDMSLLPSHKKIPDKCIDYEGSLSDVSGDIDFTDEDESFSGNAFKFISSIGESIPADLKSLRDEIYVNEYIMGTFKNSVTSIERNGTSVPDYDLRSIEKEKRDTFFKSEVEYILHGQSSGKLNRIMTQSQLLLIRFALNTLHVYTDAKKKEFAVAVATTAAGWWTGGAGIPLISNLVMCSWGMGEAITDIGSIMEGKRVPFFKKPGDWNLDIGTGKVGGKTDPRLCFSYHDYLRIFLLLKNSDEKLGRVEDLIELNLRKDKDDFRMGSCNTYLRVEATVSMKYLFVTGSFMPVKLKTEDGRHRFKVVIYEGY